MTDFQQLKDCCTARTPELKAEADAIVDRMESEEIAWIRELREQGFKAAHPNDGWVDRKNKSLHLCYPQFNDGVTLGSRIMLGWPWDKDENVPVIVIGVRTGVAGGMVYYDYVEETI